MKIISLPYQNWGWSFPVYLRLPKIKINKTYKKFFEFPRKKDKPLRKIRKDIPYDQYNLHYWEVGRKSYPLNRVMNDLLKEESLEFIEKQVNLYMPYHLFLFFRKKDKKNIV